MYKKNLIKISLVVTLLFIVTKIVFSNTVENLFSYKNLRDLQPQYLSLKQGKLEYYSFGNGSPIILISGYATNVSNWNRNFLTTLAQKHRVIIFDNRNVGGSYSHSLTYTVLDLAEDTYQLIQQLKLNKPAVLGISMGGMIAQQLAVLYPKSVGHLILINTVIAGKQGIEPDHSVQETLLHTPNGYLKRYLVGMKLLSPPGWQLRMTYALEHSGFHARGYREQGISLDTLTQQQQLVLNYRKNDLIAKKLAKISIPVLILSGDADAVIPPQNSHILAKIIPHAQLITFKQGGHAMIYQYPYGIAEDINDFMGNNSALIKKRPSSAK